MSAHPASRLLAGAVAAAAAACLAGCGAPTDPLADHGRPLQVVADDGTRLSVVEHRRDRARGLGPAVAVWPSDASDAATWRRELSRWGTGGRTLWLVASPLRDGAEASDVSAVLDALASRAGVDPGRLGAVAGGPAARALAFRTDRLQPSPAALLLVAEPVSRAPPPPPGLRLEHLAPEAPSEAAARADARLWELLAAE
jgi:hypothetical protein